MTAIFKPEGHLFRATEHAGGPWSPDMLQGSATTALMTREVERLASSSGFAVRRLTFDLWRPAGLRAFGLADEMLRDGRKAKTMQVRLLDGETEIGRCTALLTAQGGESPADPFRRRQPPTRRPKRGTPPPAFAQKWSRYFQNVSVRLIEGALEKPGPAAAWMRLDVPMVEGEANTPLLQAVQAADFSSGVGADRRHARMDLHQSGDQPVFLPPAGGRMDPDPLAHPRRRQWRRADHGDLERPRGPVRRSDAGDDVRAARGAGILKAARPGVSAFRRAIGADQGRVRIIRGQDVADVVAILSTPAAAVSPRPGAARRAMAWPPRYPAHSAGSSDKSRHSIRTTSLAPKCWPMASASSRIVARPFTRMRRLLPSRRTNNRPTLGLREILPRVRYIELPSYSGYSMTSGPTILYKAGIARLDAAIGVILPGRGDEEKRRILHQLLFVIPEFIVLALAFDGFGHATPVEAILQVAHPLVKERPLPHR